MRLFTIWDKTGTGVNEKCLMKDNGDYIGVSTGMLYERNIGYYHSKQHIGIIRKYDEKNKTGLYHLSDDVEFGFKLQKMKKYMGCIVTLEAAHSFGELQVYRCREMDEYVSSDEVEILTDQQVRKWKIEEVLENKK